MRDLSKAGLVALVLFLSVPAPVTAGPLENGIAAYSRKDYPTALRLLRPLANQGNATAQNNLGAMYGKGEGVPQDYAEAMKWYRKAAEQGNADAQLNLGNMYAKGEGVPQDYVQAATWFRKAAEQGNAVAQSYLGFMYAKGQGVPQDYVEVMKWYRKAAEQGNAAAQNDLGNMYTEGQGVPQDYVEAMKWLRKAAEQGNAAAQNNLGNMYTEGQGVPQDYVQAHKWFNLAAARIPASETESRAIPIKSRDRVASKMTPAQVAEAQKLASEWKATPVGGGFSPGGGFGAISRDIACGDGRQACDIGEVMAPPDLALPQAVEAFDGILEAQLAWWCKHRNDLQRQTQATDTSDTVGKSVPSLEDRVVVELRIRGQPFAAPALKQNWEGSACAGPLHRPGVAQRTVQAGAGEHRDERPVGDLQILDEVKSVEFGLGVGQIRQIPALGRRRPALSMRAIEHPVTRKHPVDRRALRDSLNRSALMQRQTDCIKSVLAQHAVLAQGSSHAQDVLVPGPQACGSRPGRVYGLRSLHGQCLPRACAT